MIRYSALHSLAERTANPNLMKDMIYDLYQDKDINAQEYVDLCFFLERRMKNE